jgi:LAS superfamily LD-carboxypeptidase LdcB
VLFSLFTSNPNKFALAAEPGRSNHQNGIAFDLDVGGFDGNPVYDWLKVHGPGFGFIRTVNKEPWHWEFRPAQATDLADLGKFKLPGVTV